jgi:hypothetical protein
VLHVLSHVSSHCRSPPPTRFSPFSQCQLLGRVWLCLVVLFMFSVIFFVVVVLFAFVLSLGFCLGFYLPILLLVCLMGEILPSDICPPILCVV